MGDQAARQVARRRVSEALAIKQRERVEREKRLSEEAATVLTALAERDVAIATKESDAAMRRAANAMTRSAMGDGSLGRSAKEDNTDIAARRFSPLNRPAAMLLTNPQKATHDYARNGTPDMLAALNVGSGQ